MKALLINTENKIHPLTEIEVKDDKAFEIFVMEDKQLLSKVIWNAMSDKEKISIAIVEPEGLEKFIAAGKINLIPLDGTVKVVTTKQKQILQYKLDRLTVLVKAMRKFEIIGTEREFNFFTAVLTFALQNAEQFMKNEFNIPFYPFIHSEIDQDGKGGVTEDYTSVN